MPANEAELLAETNRINYRLRSTFFYRKLKEYNTLAFPALISTLFPVEHLYLWDEREQWGIGEDAFNYINGNPDIHLVQVFCHPRLLREHPRLIAYYRNVAALSQKAVGYMAKPLKDIKKIESDFANHYSLSEDKILKLVQIFNEHITLIVDSSIQTITKEELYGILLASTGAQIDGSWRNAIGLEAEKVVQRLLVKELKELGWLAALIPRVGQVVELFDSTRIEEQLGHIDLYRGFLLTNGTSILFSSDPDISVLDQNGATVCALEIKGGADPAGALERYGAAKKSFDEVRRTSPNASTILVASCITTEVRTRIEQDSQISLYYNLTEMLVDGSSANAHFMQTILSYLNITTP